MRNKSEDASILWPLNVPATQTVLGTTSGKSTASEVRMLNLDPTFMTY